MVWLDLTKSIWINPTQAGRGDNADIPYAPGSAEDNLRISQQVSHQIWEKTSPDGKKWRKELSQDIPYQ